MKISVKIQNYQLSIFVLISHIKKKHNLEIENKVFHQNENKSTFMKQNATIGIFEENGYFMDILTSSSLSKHIFMLRRYGQMPSNKAIFFNFYITSGLDGFFNFWIKTVFISEVALRMC